MKKIKLLSVISLFLLSSCSLFNNDMTLTAKYVKKNSTVELTSGEEIEYGENFNFDHFVLYKTSNGKTTKVESGYKVTFSSSGKTEEMFKSNKPEVGEYNFSFEYRGKYTGLGFRVNKNDVLPSNITMSMEDWDFLGDKTHPTFTNYTPSENSNIRYDLIDGETDAYYGLINLDDEQKILLNPGHYKLEATISDDHYIGATVQCDFYVKKIDFPSDILEVYNNSFNYTFMINYHTLHGYDLDRPIVRYKDTKADLPVPQDRSTLSWKDETEAISTSTVTKHKVVFCSEFFNDYEYEVNVTVNKLKVDEPGGLYIDELFAHGDSIKYDGNEHTAYVIDLSFFGQYIVDEERSVLKATEKGTYDVYVILVDKENLLWKKTQNTEDIKLSWTIW